LIETSLAHVIRDKAEQAYAAAMPRKKTPRPYGSVGGLLRSDAVSERREDAAALKTNSN
jgi:hypothetical protein